MKQASCRYIELTLEFLLKEIIYKGLEITELEEDAKDLEDTEDDEKWTVARASATLLKEIAFLIGDPVWQPTVEYL